MASVSMAARDSLRVTVCSSLRRGARSGAVRNVQPPATRTRLTPRGRVMLGELGDERLDIGSLRQAGGDAAGVERRRGGEEQRLDEAQLVGMRIGFAGAHGVSGGLRR